MSISPRLLDVDLDALRRLQVQGVRPPPQDQVWLRLERAGLAFREGPGSAAAGAVWKLTPEGCLYGLD
jgi:hypothetical protein